MGVQMQTVLRVADNSGAKLARCIQVLKGTGKPRAGTVGDQLVVSVISADPANATSSPKASKGQVHRALVVRAKREPLRPDGSFVRTGETACVLLQRPTGKDGGGRVMGPSAAPLGSRIKGPVSGRLDKFGYWKISALARVSCMSTWAGLPRL